MSTRSRSLALALFSVSLASWGCSSSDAPNLFGPAPDAGGGGSTEDGGGGDADTNAGTCQTAADCDDGIPCTIDSCAFGECRHAPGTGEGVCPVGQQCEVGKGCVPGVVCSSDDVCKERFADDPCKTNVRCNTATATCEFSILDADRDGHPPIVCGGGDCNDADPLIFPGRGEACNGKDDNCNGVVDDAAVCPGGGVCQQGTCNCPPASLCNGACVDYQTDVANCGFCGNACGLSESCQNGVCVAGTDCKPTALFVMQDISGSMANDGKLTAAVEGLSNFITAPSSSGLRLGLGFYPLAKLEIPPLTCTTDADCGAYGPCFTLFGICQGTLQGDFEPDSCEVSDYAQPEVPIAALPGNASALTNALTGKSAVGGSPLTTPLKGAIQYARDWAIANPGFQVAVVLVTDNVPTVCNDTIQGAVQAAQAGLSTSPPVRTFVIKMAGTDGTPEQWNGLAQAGGTSVARTVATSAQMREALEAIRVAASACP